MHRVSHNHHTQPTIGPVIPPVLSFPSTKNGSPTLRVARFILLSENRKSYSHKPEGTVQRVCVAKRATLDSHIVRDCESRLSCPRTSWSAIRTLLIPILTSGERLFKFISVFPVVSVRTSLSFPDFIKHVASSCVKRSFTQSGIQSGFSFLPKQSALIEKGALFEPLNINLHITCCF